MTDDFSELDALLKGGRTLQHKARAAKAAEAPPQTPNQLYLNPENWERSRGVALIHKETQTLLGNFDEFLHKRVAGAKKLVRAESPIQIDSVEYVSGGWWLGEDRRPPKAEMWTEQRECILHVQLGDLALHAPGVRLLVAISFGGIAQAALTAETTFMQTEGTERFITLPAGTNIYPCMTRDCKIKLRMEIRL